MKTETFQIIAAREHKELKEKAFYLCVLCVLLRPSALVPASDANPIRIFLPRENTKNSKKRFLSLRSLRSFAAISFGSGVRCHPHPRFFAAREHKELKEKVFLSLRSLRSFAANSFKRFLT